jgi:hypothetical protein
VERVPFALMDRLIQHPNRWAPVVESAKPAIIATLGTAYSEDAWADGKHEAWLLYAEHHNFDGWPSARPV